MMKLRITILAVGLISLAGCQSLQELQGSVLGSGAPNDAAAATPDNPGFTGEDLVIWNSLNDQAKVDALEYIRNGGTLKQFVAL